MWRLFTYMEHIYSIPYHDFTCHQKCSCALKKAYKYQSRNCTSQFRDYLHYLTGNWISVSQSSAFSSFRMPSM